MFKNRTSERSDVLGKTLLVIQRERIRGVDNTGISRKTASNVPKHPALSEDIFQREKHQRSYMYWLIAEPPPPHPTSESHKIHTSLNCKPGKYPLITRCSSSSKCCRRKSSRRRRFEPKPCSRILKPCLEQTTHVQKQTTHVQKQTTHAQK